MLYVQKTNEYNNTIILIIKNNNNKDNEMRGFMFIIFVYCELEVVIWLYF